MSIKIDNKHLCQNIIDVFTDCYYYLYFVILSPGISLTVQILLLFNYYYRYN